MALTLKRIGLMACIVLGVLSLGVSLASAAGKPTSVSLSNTHELNGYTVLELTAKVNPNGASTSTTIELREEGAGTWAIQGETHNLSGTTVRTYSEELRVAPNKNYEARIVAKNLYGTTESSIAKGVATRLRSTGEKELVNVPYGSEGIASFVIRMGGIPLNIICHENSSGRIGNPGGAEDIYNFSMSGCAFYINEKLSKECKIGNFKFTLGGPTLSVKNMPYITFPGSEECSFGGAGLWISPDPFRVVDGGSATEYGKNRPVLLTATGTYGSGNPAEISIESTWFMTAEYVGTLFKVANVGL